MKVDNEKWAKIDKISKQVQESMSLNKKTLERLLKELKELKK